MNAYVLLSLFATGSAPVPANAPMLTTVVVALAVLFDVATPSPLAIVPEAAISYCTGVRVQ